MNLIISEELTVPKNAFYQALYIYVTKQQVVNRKLSSVTNVVSKKLKQKVDNLVLSVGPATEIIKIFEADGECCISLELIQNFKGKEDVCILSVDNLIPRNLEVFPKLQVATLIGNVWNIHETTLI